MFSSMAEWYEYIIYIYCAGIIGATFFPQSSQVNAYIAAFFVFAMGYLVRPIGAIIFGYIGDRYSRAAALSLSSLLMGLAALIIGLLPGYQTMGIFASIVLIICRVLQGLSLGGQYSGSVVMIIERYGLKDPMSSALAVFGSFVGVVIALVLYHLASYFLTSQYLSQGGWRVFYLASILLIILSLYLRRLDIQEEVDVKAHQPSLPLLELFKSHKKAMLKVILMCIPGAITSCYLLTMMPVILINYFDISSSAIVLNSIIGLIIFTLSLFLSVSIVRVIGAKNTMLFALGIFAILALPLLYMVSINSLYISLLYSVLGLVLGIFYGVFMLPLVAFFPSDLRYSGFSFAYNVGFGVFVGILPVVSLYLTKLYGVYSVAFFAAGVAIISLIIVYFIVGDNHYVDTNA